MDAAIDRLDWNYPQRIPRLRSLSGDLGMDDPNVREKLHQRDLATVGIPTSIEPISKVPLPEQYLRHSERGERRVLWANSAQSGHGPQHLIY